jgi:2-polyprenyl-3-methyl-5-hydroxy-6-metoxy-1,4-benzoquinol methylase
MDLGCAVGRSSFELTRLFDKVVGIDYSTRFIQVASALMKVDEILYRVPVEGEIVKHK